VPGLQLISEVLANVVSTAVNIYNYVADIASQLQLWGSLMQGNWKEFGASIGLAIGGAALSTFIDPIVSGFQTALFRGENVLKGAWQGLLDGYNNFADAFSRELKNIFIPFYGLYGGPGHPEKEAFDEKTGKFNPDHKGINAIDEAYKEHDAIGRQLEVLKKNKVINSYEQKTMRRWSDRKLFRRLLRSAPTVHLLDIAFSGQFGGRPMIGSGSKFLSVPLFGIRGYIFR
jgi:hypothetical protein